MNETPQPTASSNRTWGLSRIWRLASKELRETLRDRRTIATLVLMPLILYPILSLIFQNFLVSSLQNMQDDELPYNILCTSNLNEQDTMNFLIGSIAGQLEVLDREEARKAKSSDAETEDDSQEVTEELDYQVSPLVMPPKRKLQNNLWLFLDEAHSDELIQAVAQGDADVGMIVELNLAKRRVERFQIVQRDDAFSIEAADYLRDCFERYNRAYAKQMLSNRRAQLPIADPEVSVIKVDGGQNPRGMIASLIPLALVLMTITGAVYPAIDLTAGERERGTLETLMAAPVPRMSILFAKFIAVVTVAILTAVLNLIGMTIVMWVFQLDQMLPGGGLTIGIITKVFFLLVLFAAFFAACLLMVTSFARSFKEAQAYLVPIILFSLGPGLLAMSPSVTLGGLTAVTPMMNLLVLARDVMQGQAQAGPAAIAILSTLVYAFVALSIAARTFGADSILYSQEANLASMLKRPRKSSALMPLVPALLCLALLLPVNMISIGVLGRLAEQLADNFSLACGLMACFTILSFFLIPTIAAWINRVEFRTGFGLRGSRTSYFIAAVILGLSLWPIVMLMVQGTYAIYGSIAGETAASARHDMLVELAGNQVENFRQVSPLLIAICFSIVPAFCEEWFFRGMLLRSMLKEWKASNAILATAILFGVFHILSGSAISLDRFLPTMLIGILLGYLAWKSKSLWPGVVFHTLHNAAVVFLGYYQEKLSELSWFPKETDQVPWSWAVVACVLAAIGLAILFKSPPETEAAIQ